MKFNNETAKEQMVYVAPTMKVFNVRPQGVICGSLDQDNSGEEIGSQSDWSGNGGWNLQ